MTRKAFSPKTRLQDEREITRVQEDFSSGLFKDVPASKIPENGVANLKNCTNFGTYIQARSGSREWGDYGTYTASAALPSLVTGIGATSTASGTTRTITISSGYTPTSDSVGDWFVHDDGVHERITAYNSPTEIETYTDSTADKTSTAAWVRAQVNSIYFHNTERKVVLLIGQKLYISNDYTMTSWTAVTFVGNNSELPTNSVSQIEEFNNVLFLFNANGIYKFYLDQTPYLYYKLNVSVPEGIPTTTVDLADGEYTRRYTYTNVRLSGTGVRDRNTSGVVIETETGNILANSDYTDYGSASTVATFGAAVPITIDDLNVSTNASSEIAQHFTHIGLYATLDIGVKGVNPVNRKGNNTELYIWLADVPIYKYIVADYAGYLARATYNSFVSGDMFNAYNPKTSGQESIAITTLATATTDTILSAPMVSYNSVRTFSVNSGTDVITVAGAHGITTSGMPLNIISTVLPAGLIENALYYATNIDGDDIQLASGYAGALAGTPIVNLTSVGTSNKLLVGANDIKVTMGNPTFSITCSQDAGGVLTQSPYSVAFGSGFVGKTIYMGDNTYRHITSVVSASGVNVAESGSSYTLASGTAGSIDIASTSTVDIKTDARLRDMIAGWTLNNRFYEPLPNSDIATVVPGYMAVATRDENKMYYSQMPEGYEYLTGYYHPGYQYANFKGAIRALSSVPNLLIIYCAGSTHTMPLNVFDERKIEELGISVAVIAGQNEVDSSIGLLDYGSLANVDQGRQIMITNEPAIRVFDGHAYSENIASQRIMDDLRSLQAATSAIYHNIIGYVFWGNNT